jgi:hypothetical protein
VGACPLRPACPVDIFGDSIIRACGPCNPLKRLKTANEMFGKACRFQAIDLQKLGAYLEKLAGYITE